MNMQENMNTTDPTGKHGALLAKSMARFHVDELQLREELDTYRLELKKTHKRLEDVSRLFSRIIDNATEGILITDTRNIIQAVNPAFEKSTGYSAKEAIGKTPALFNPDTMTRVSMRKCGRP